MSLIYNDNEKHASSWIFVTFKIAKFSLSAAPKVIILKTTDATNNESFVNMNIFLFQYLHKDIERHTAQTIVS